MAELGVTVIGAAAHVVAEGMRGADGIAVPVQAPRGEVIGVHVHPDDLAGAQRVQRNRRDLLALPGRVQIPAAGGRIVVDTVGDSVIRGDPVGPFVAAVRETHSSGQDVAAMWGVRQRSQRRGQSDRHLAFDT